MKPLILIVLDGWGIAPPGKGNAITQANPEFFNSLWKKHPHCKLRADGKFVGLLPGYMGNSEVGHLHIGAGRLVKQELARIFDAIKDKSFFRNKVLVKAMKRAKKPGKALHLLGLVSDGGVHSHIGHLLALLDMAKKFKVPQVYVHAILDGRDTPPKSASKYLHRVEKKLKKLDKNWKIATIMGRYYAMDRDNRWNREHKAYDAMVNNKGYQYKNWQEALADAYKRGETDEFVRPSIIARSDEVKKGDAVVFYNFRSDRARELTRAFVQGKFNKFKRKKIIDLYFVCLTQYDPDIKAPVAFPPVKLNNTLGEVISKAGLRQYRLAETEKWAHVTYFFNGLSGRIFKKEDRLLIPSPKITTYDKKPEMSANKIADKALEVLKSGKYPFMLVNFANADMVGHTGRLNKTIKAVKVLDSCLKKIIPIAQKNGYSVIITADHGNAEQMLYPDGTICTAHTTNKVPCIIIADKKLKTNKAALHNIAPTALALMKLKKPKEMKSKSLV